MLQLRLHFLQHIRLHIHKLLHSQFHQKIGEYELWRNGFSPFRSISFFELDNCAICRNFFIFFDKYFNNGFPKWNICVNMSNLTFKNTPNINMDVRTPKEGQMEGLGHDIRGFFYHLLYHYILFHIPFHLPHTRPRTRFSSLVIFNFIKVPIEGTIFICIVESFVKKPQSKI